MKQNNRKNNKRLTPLQFVSEIVYDVNKKLHNKNFIQID